MAPSPDSPSLESQLDALLSQVEADPPETPGPRENAKNRGAELDDADDPIARAESALDSTQDLAAKLDAMFAATAEPKPTRPAPRPAATPPPPATTAAAPAADRFASLSSKLDEMLNAPPSPADGSPDAGRPVAEYSDDTLEQAESESDAEVALVDEAAMLAAIEDDVAADADAALEQEEFGGDFASLADMLGVEADTLAAIPPTAPDPAAVVARNITEDVAEAASAAEQEDFAGAFQSVDDLLAELDPALAEIGVDEELLASEAVTENLDAPNAGADDADGEADDTFAGSFEAVDDLDAPAPSAVKPPSPTREPETVVATHAEIANDDLGDALDGDFASVDDVLSEATAPTAAQPARPAMAKKLTETAVTTSRQAIEQSKVVAIRLRPHAIRAAKLAYRGFKLGCFHAHQPLDLAAEKLRKEGADAPPVRQYVGMAAMAVLIPGVLLVLIGLLT